MTVAATLEEALAAGRRHAAGDERAVAVMGAEPHPRAPVFLVAFERDDGELSYLALDEEHRPVRDRRLVRDAVTLAALAERAEEVSGAAAAGELAERFESLGRELREASRGAADAAAAVSGAAAELARDTAGPRIPTPAYLDLLLQRARALGEALDAYVAEAQALAAGVAQGGPPEEGSPAHAAWQGLAAAAAVGDPAGIGPAMAAAAGAVDALADDVVRRYRDELAP